MPQYARFALRGKLVPENAATARIEGQHAELLRGGILPVVTLTLELGLEDHRRVCTNRGGEKDPVVPNNGTRQSQAGDLSLPGNVRSACDVPTHRQIGVAGNTARTHASKARPVLGRRSKRGEGQQENNSVAHG